MSDIYKYEVKRFELVLAGGKDRPAAGGCRVAITLYDTTGPLAQLYFHNETGSMPDQDTTPTEGDPNNYFVKSHYLMSDYPNVLGLLTSGKPVYCGHMRNPPQVWLTNDPSHVSRVPCD